MSMHMCITFTHMSMQDTRCGSKEERLCGMAYIVMAYAVMAYIIMAYSVMAYIVMAHIVMAPAAAAKKNVSVASFV